jgi:hypothetical protein
MRSTIRRTGAVLAWLLFVGCRAYDADLLESPAAHQATSPSRACQQHVELCNGEDDDCDGIVDESASATCSSQHARERCVLGACEISACDFGFVDCDGEADDGCEQLITRAGCELAVATGRDVVVGSDADAGP